MNEQQPTASVEWGGDGVTYSKPAPVVVGGRYVVGENPTFHEEDGSTGHLGRWIVGETVTVIGGPDPDGDVQVMASNRCQRWIDPRHLSPAPEPAACGVGTEPWKCIKPQGHTDHHEPLLSDLPEPAAAPAVDDDLLRDLMREAATIVLRNDQRTEIDEGRALLASEPMQRLRDAWTAGVDARVLASNTALTKAMRERDEAVEQRNGAQQELEQARDEALNNAVGYRVERDEARAELSYALGEVERLRAAQPQLPDVGPVTRDGHGQLLCGGSLSSVGTTASELRAAAQGALRSAAELSAIADRIDEEADSSDDEVPDTPGSVVRVGHVLWMRSGMGCWVNEDAEVLHDAGFARLAHDGVLFDAHRPRGAQEAADA